MYAAFVQAGKHQSVFGKARHHAFAFLATGFAATLLLAGCGNTYRPVVSAIGLVGPAAQPTKYAVAVSNQGPTAAGLLTIVDFSGDTVLSTPSILTNPVAPLDFTLVPGGSEGVVINAAGSLNDFGLVNPTGLRSTNVVQTTLPAASAPVSITTFALSGASTNFFVPEAGTPANPGSRIAILSNTGPSLVQEVAVGANPVYVVGINGAPRAYAISQGDGSVSALEAGTFSVSAKITVGTSPVYGVMTSDARRTFILNQGSGSVSVINTFTNGLDVTTPMITLPPISIGGGATVAPNPVWADLSPLTTELVVLNKGDGVHPGTLSLISIPLCTTTSQVSNPSCIATDDAVGFGTIVKTVPVGINPSMVSVLQDGTRAYVVNSGNATSEGSVSVVNLTSGVVTATIPATSVASATANTNTTPTAIYGHPNTLATTTGTPTGKVYVTSSDSNFMTVIYTDTDTVQVHVPLQGLGVRVLMTAP